MSHITDSANIIYSFMFSIALINTIIEWIPREKELRTWKHFFNYVFVDEYRKDRWLELGICVLFFVFPYLFSMFILPHILFFFWSL